MTKRTFKWLKRFTLIFAIIPILVFLAFVGAINFIDFNQYKAQIEAEVSELTQRSFRIQGGINVSVLPLTLKIQDMTLQSSKDDADNPLMTVKEVQMVLSLKAFVLQQKLKVLHLELMRPTMNFVALNAQENNWSGIPLLANTPLQPHPTVSSQGYAIARMQGLPELQAPSVSRAEASPPTQALAMAQSIAQQFSAEWTLESLVIHQAHLRYEHQQQDIVLQLKALDLMAFDVRLHRPFRMQSEFVYEHSQSPRAFAFELNGQLMLGNDYKQVHLSDWHGVFSLSLPQSSAQAPVRMTTQGQNVMVDFQHQQLYVKNAVLEGLNNQVTMNFQGGFGANPSFSGELSTEQMNVSDWARQIGLPKPEMVLSLKDEPINMSQVQGKLEWRWNGTALKLKTP